LSEYTRKEEMEKEKMAFNSFLQKVFNLVCRLISLDNLGILAGNIKVIPTGFQEITQGKIEFFLTQVIPIVGGCHFVLPA